MLGWANRFNIFCFLDNQSYDMPPHRLECLLGVGTTAQITNAGNAELDSFLARPGYKFGHLNFERNNELFDLNIKQDRSGFPTSFFFIPEHTIVLNEGELTIHGDDPEKIFNEICNVSLAENTQRLNATISPLLTRDQYIEKVEHLKAHILRGDCYEINFCMEFEARNIDTDATYLYQQLAFASPNPFSACYRINSSYLLCASPERFLTKQGQMLISQPIKGTIRRNKENVQSDELLKNQLKESAKDQSENVMIVDLVRNDLSRICNDGSVHVSELFGIHSFPQVHHMISTVVGELPASTPFSTILDATFPMGSMTGAPKKRVMELIDEYEPQSRGIFSGSLGYFDPSGDFDLNVVIRSIMYNSEKKALFYQVGSGITFYSNPEQEWEECLLKATAIKKVLG